MSLSVTVATVLVSPTSTTGRCAGHNNSFRRYRLVFRTASSFVVLLTVISTLLPNRPGGRPCVPGPCTCRRNIQYRIVAVEIGHCPERRANDDDRRVRSSFLSSRTRPESFPVVPPNDVPDPMTARAASSAGRVLQKRLRSAFICVLPVAKWPVCAAKRRLTGETDCSGTPKACRSNKELLQQQHLSDERRARGDHLEPVVVRARREVGRVEINRVFTGAVTPRLREETRRPRTSNTSSATSLERAIWNLMFVVGLNGFG